MTMTFSVEDNYENFAGSSQFEFDSAAHHSPKKRTDKVRLFADKLCVPPPLENYVSRPRLDELFQNSLEKIGALLITGRAGTGKTALAAHFSHNYQQTVWYRVEAADNDWNVFSSYLTEGMEGKPPRRRDENIARFTEKLFGEKIKKSKSPRLIVLDGVHNVFDAEWFEPFFTTALYSQSPATHLIFLARSQPALPLWRLRSKQFLAVIDEKMLAFNRQEAEKVCEKSGIPAKITEELLTDSSGRIGKLKNLLETNDK